MKKFDVVIRVLLIVSLLTMLILYVCIGSEWTRKGMWASITAVLIYNLCTGFFFKNNSSKDHRNNLNMSMPPYSVSNDITLKKAIEERHSVRSYAEQPIAEDALAALKQKIEDVNAETGLHIQLVLNEPKAFSGKGKLSTYGRFTGCSNYLVMAGKKSDDLDEKVGYYGEQLVLLAQTLGLNTCWVGVTYNKIAGTYVLNEDEKIACYISIGYGETQGVSHKIKSASDVSNASDLTPEWFRAGVDAALLAPTAVNQQKFFIMYLGRMDGSAKPLVAIRRGASVVGYTQMDMGIVRLHFEIGAGRENFEWKND